MPRRGLRQLIEEGIICRFDFYRLNDDDQERAIEEDQLCEGFNAEEQDWIDSNVANYRRVHRSQPVQWLCEECFLRLPRVRAMITDNAIKRRLP